jgi:predicted nucleic acid-binding protein
VITGIDTNILCYALDPFYPENKKVKDLLTTLSPENQIAINPTVLHETYHTLITYAEWTQQEAALRLTALLKHPFIMFYNQTRKTSLIALDLAVKHNIDARDSLIIANFLANKTPTIYTHDKQLLKHQKIAWKNMSLTIKDPLTT